MTEPLRRQILIYYRDGSRERIEFQPREIEPAALTSYLEKMLRSEWLIIELEDRLRIIPRAAVKYFELYPKPATAPPNALQDGRVLD